MVFIMFPSGIPLSKRIFDLIVTSAGLIIISPVLLLIGLIIWLRHGSPIFYRQTRPGYHAAPFSVIKFRTMSSIRSQEGNLLPDAQRITGIGGFLRSASIDELPELINVLKGDMSLVGPRPLLMQYLDRYSPEQARRHDVLPGITGWAQVNGRNAVTWEEKFRHDVWYVDNWSFILDIKILLTTVIKVLKREGISQPGHATAPEFMGSEVPDE